MTHIFKKKTFEGRVWRCGHCGAELESTLDEFKLEQVGRKLLHYGICPVCEHKSYLKVGRLRKKVYYYKIGEYEDTNVKKAEAE